MKYENGDLPADSHNILNSRKTTFLSCYVHNNSDVKGIQVHTAEALQPGHSLLELETVIAKLAK
jgi:hypothetical protein